MVDHLFPHCNRVQILLVVFYMMLRRAGWTVRQFDSHALSEVPCVVLCLCVHGGGTFLHIARCEVQVPRSGAQQFSSSRTEVSPPEGPEILIGNKKCSSDSVSLREATASAY